MSGLQEPRPLGPASARSEPAEGPGPGKAVLARDGLETGAQRASEQLSSRFLGKQKLGVWKVSPFLLCSAMNH